MATSHQKILLDTFWTTITARSAFTSADVLLVKTSDYEYAEIERGSANAGKYPQLFVFSTGYAGGTPVKTFGVGLPVATFDYGESLNFTINARLVFHFMTDAQLMPLEAEVEAAIRQTFLALRAANQRWAGPPTMRYARENRQFGEMLRTVCAWSPSYECRPRLSSLIS